MTTTLKAIIESKFAENALTTQYTANLAQVQIDKFTATNVSASNANITVHLVPSGGTAGASNIITQTRVLAPGEDFGFPAIVGHILESGDFIATLASAASAIVIRSSARINT